MKKIISLLLIFLFVFLCSCGSGSSSNGGSKSSATAKQKATVYNKTGTTEQMTGDELLKAYNENMARFNKLYDGAKVSLVATVLSVKTNTRIQGGYLFDEIRCEDGWNITLAQPHSYSLIDITKGTRIEVEGSIRYGTSYINIGSIEKFIILD